MKRIVEDSNVSGLEALLGEIVLLLCANYFYHGKLKGVNSSFVELEDPSIVYDTGEWSASSFVDKQSLPTKTWYVQTSFIESFGISK